MKVSDFSKPVKGAIARAANKNKISHDEAEEMVAHFFRFMRKWLADYRCPRIAIKYFGEFRPALWKINKGIRQRLWAYRSGYKTRKSLYYFIKRYWAIRNRLIQEKNNENTWKTWSRKKDWMKEDQ